MRHLLRFVLCALFAFLMFGCTPEATIPKDAEDAVTAFNDFIESLKACGSFRDETGNALPRPTGLPECDKSKIYDALDSQTRNELITAYVTLVKIDNVISQYFDSIEHKQLRSVTGTEILQKADPPIKSNKDLFFYLFKPSEIVFNENVISGLTITKATIINPNQVKIETHMNGQEFLMVKEKTTIKVTKPAPVPEPVLDENGEVIEQPQPLEPIVEEQEVEVWKTAVLANYVAVAVDPILSSDTAMTEYAKSNLEAEFNRRAAVRDYFILQQDVRRRQYQEELLNQKKAELAKTQPVAEEAPAAEDSPEENDDEDDGAEE